MAEIREVVGHRLLLIPAVAAILRDEAGRVLFMRAAVDGRWSLPAGGIEPGESPAQAAIREVYEETGLHVEVVGVVGVFGGEGFRMRYPNGDEVEATVVVLECAVRGGTLRAVDGEALELAWFAVDEAPPLPGYPADLLVPRPHPRF